MLVDKTPFVVIQDDKGMVQLTADQVDFELNSGDMIFVEQDLPQQEGNLVMSQCHCLVQDQPIRIILPKQNYRLINNQATASSSQPASAALSWTNLNRITEETRSE